MHNSQWIPIPTQSYLVFYSFCSSWLHSFIMTWTISSLCIYNYTCNSVTYCQFSLQYNWSLLLCAAIRRDSVSLLRFPFLSHVQIISCAILVICHLKYTHSCFSFHFCFLVFVVLLVLTLSVQLLATIICLYLLFLMYSLSPCINASTQFSVLLSPLYFFFFLTNLFFLLSLECRALCIVVIFLVLWLICLTIIHFKNSPEYLTRGNRS